MSTPSQNQYSLFIPELEPFRIAPEDISGVFIKPKEFNRAYTILQDERIVWLNGEPGIGKRTIAQNLALQLQQDQTPVTIYQIPRSMHWEQLHEILTKAETTATQTDTQSLPITINERLQIALQEIDCFQSNEALRAFISLDTRLNNWAPDIPETSTISNRINQTSIFLLRKQHQQTNGLTIFLQVLGEKYRDFETADELDTLADTLHYLASRSESALQLTPNNNFFVFPDALGAIRFERTNLEGEFAFLKQLAQHNYIVVTTPMQILEQANSTMRLDNIMSSTISLTERSYTAHKKTTLFKKFLLHATKSGKIDKKQESLVQSKLLDINNREGKQQINPELRERLGKWLPIDIYRYIYVLLPQADKESDALSLLHQGADLDSRIRDWFIKLNDSTRAFIFTLMFVAARPDRDIWANHKKIIARLREFDASLTIPPLGILRQHAAPYVTTNGVIDFVNSRVHKAILSEVAKSYREYFTDSHMLFEEFSLTQHPERGTWITSVYSEFTLFVGALGQTNLDDIEPFLRMWASHQERTVRVATGDALSFSASTESGANSVLDLLTRWLHQFSNDQQEASRNIRWTVGAIIWRIVSSRSPEYQIRRTLNIIALMVGDQQPYVVSSAAFALMKISTYLPLNRTEQLLSNIAKRKHINTRYVVWALNTSVNAEQNSSVTGLLKRWLELENKQRREIAYDVILLGDNFPINERVELFHQLINSEIHKSNFTSALYQIYKPNKSKNSQDVMAVAKVTKLIEYAAIKSDTSGKQLAFAQLLDKLLTQEMSSNDKPDIMDKTFKGIVQEWLARESEILQYIMGCMLWIGVQVDTERRKEWFSESAAVNPTLFKKSLATVIQNDETMPAALKTISLLLQDSEIHEIVSSLLEQNDYTYIQLTQSDGLTQSELASTKQLLENNSAAFLTLLHNALHITKDKNVVGKNLTTISREVPNLVVTISDALRGTYRTNINEAQNITDQFISSGLPGLRWIACHALLNTDWGISWKSLSRIAGSDPATLLEVSKWYKESRSDASHPRATLKSLTNSSLKIGQQTILAFAQAIHENRIQYNAISEGLQILPNEHVSKFRGEVGQQVRRDMVNDMSRFSLRAFLASWNV